MYNDKFSFRKYNPNNILPSGTDHPDLYKEQLCDDKPLPRNEDLGSNQEYQGGMFSGYIPLLVLGGAGIYLYSKYL